METAIQIKGKICEGFHVVCLFVTLSYICCTLFSLSTNPFHVGCANKFILTFLLDLPGDGSNRY